MTYKITGAYFVNDAYRTETYEFGAAVTALDKPSKAGYTFSGWSGEPETMPAEDVIVTGYYTVIPVIVEPVAGMSLEKAGVYVDYNEDGLVNIGDRIGYTVTVKNTGETVLHGVTVSDPMIGLDEVIEVLGIGEVRTYTGYHTLTEQDLLAGSVVNKVTAEAEELDEPEEIEIETELELVMGDEDEPDEEEPDEEVKGDEDDKEDLPATGADTTLFELFPYFGLFLMLAGVYLFSKSKVKE